MAYGIGLDIGIGSVGWAVLALDHEENPWGIIDLGSRIFDVAEYKTGDSLAFPRRQARSMRRRLRRHRHRLERIKNLLISSKLISQEQMDLLYEGQLEDIYELRVRALDEKLTNEELARALLHLAKRRGFKSNRKAESASEEAGALKKAISLNQAAMDENHYRTVGEMFYKDSRYTEYKRNRGGNYLNTVDRSMVEDEARKIIETQRQLGNPVMSPDFEESYLFVLLSQRQFDEGPGGKSHYGGNQILNMVGPCTFEKGEKRAPKACYSFEYFNLLQKINHFRLTSSKDNRPLKDAERKRLIELAKTTADLRYSKIRKELMIDDSYLFADIFYKADPDAEEKKAKFNYLPFYHQIKAKLKSAGENAAEYPVSKLDTIGAILTFYKGDDARRKNLTEAGIPDKAIEALLLLTGVRKFNHLSLKALRKITPFLEQGMVYNEACDAAGYDFRAHEAEKSMYLPANPDKAPELDDITNPVVRRAIGQTIKVVNAIIRKQGASPLYVNVELAREMAKDRQERTKINNIYKDNQAKNEKLIQEIKENYHVKNPSGMDLVKYKLWKEQDGKSPYSQKAIDLDRLFETGYVEVDHIIPYSISFDDSYKNKVLVFSYENQVKGNRLPYPYIFDKYGKDAADSFKVWVNNSVRDFSKKQRLLKEHLSEDEMNNFKVRNLQDTKYLSRFLYNFIRDHLEFAPSETGKKKRVLAVNGLVTSYLRKRWGIRKVRANGDKHHAVDAVVIASTTDRMIQNVTMYSKLREEGDHPSFPEPWEGFRQEVEARCSDHPERGLAGLPFYVNKDWNAVKPIFVSRMPRRKVTGAAHKDTIRSARHIQDGITVSKVPLETLKLDKNGEIDGYYNPDSDRLLYEALKARLEKFDGKGKKAFTEPFYKPKADGSQGPLVKKVKIQTNATLAVPVNQKTGVADNGSRVRVDVFYVDGDGYYLVPIYVADTLKKVLPNRAVIAYKPYDQWKVMENRNFIFSLHPNDLICIKAKKLLKFSIKKELAADSTLRPNVTENNIKVYFKGLNVKNGSIHVMLNAGVYEIRSLGAKTLQSIEKYQVDVLGNITRVKKEKRIPFIIKHKKW